MDEAELVHQVKDVKVRLGNVADVEEGRGEI